MYLLCGVISDFWNEYVINASREMKSKIGLAMIIVSIILFVLCTKGSKKGEMIGKWWLFWISSALFVLSIFYINL